MDLGLFVPGRRVVIETRMGLVAHKVQTRVIGVREPDFLLVDMPANGDAPLLIERDEPCLVHVLDGGRIVDVPARLNLAVHEPFAMGILQRTGRMRERRVRGDERVDCNFDAIARPRNATLHAPGRMRHVPEDGGFRGALIDLSVSGCQIAIPVADPEAGFLASLGGVDAVPESDRECYGLAGLEAQFAKGRFLDLDFVMPKPCPGSHEGIACQVRWRRASGSVLLVGAQFDAPPEPFVAAVERIVNYQRRFFTCPVRNE